MSIVLETQRLLLRCLTLDDVDDLLGIFSDPEAMRYYPATKGREETIAWVDWNLRSYGEHGFGLIDPGNAASVRVARKVGMSLEKEVERWGKRIQVYGIHQTGGHAV